MNDMSLLFSTSCAGCRQPGAVLCRTCRFAFAATPAPAPVHLRDATVRAAFRFDGVARQAVLSLKHRNRRGAARQLAVLAVRRLQLRAGSYDVVTWAPTSRGRVAGRGFDQAQLLARAVARELGVPCRRLLYRTHGGSQVGHTRAERLAGPRFRARRPARPLRVLVVDDVVTTGATLVAAGEALLAAGLTHVELVAVAATQAAVRQVGVRAIAAAAPPGRLACA